MQAHYAEQFERDMACTETEWLRWLPGATQGLPLDTSGAGQATVRMDGGQLRLHWRALPERQIALVRLPRLGVRFVFSGVDEDRRQRFMRYFDLYTQRGGG
jgi:hypothetical protein